MKGVWHPSPLGSDCAPSPSITFGFEANSTNNPAIDLSVLSSANDMS